MPLAWRLFHLAAVLAEKRPHRDHGRLDMNDPFDNGLLTFFYLVYTTTVRV